MKKPYIIVHLFLSLCLLLLTVPCLAIENDECMDCHGDPDLTRMESQGVKQNLSLDYRKFQYSIHNINGIACVDCHSDITELNFDNEVPHALSIKSVDCSTCHEEEGQAYSKSVHMQAASKGMSIKCSACHGYHEVMPGDRLSVLERENKSCLKCHNPFSLHAWLPQKETHFAYVECTVCHAPDSPRHIHLRFFDLVKKDFIDSTDILTSLGTDLEGFLPLIDTDNSGSFSAKEFESMVFILRKRGVHVTFHGELLSEHQPLIHQVTLGNAERDCQDCHLPLSPFFEAVTLFFNNEDGTVTHINVDREVLQTYAVSNFNVPGGTRIRELDLIGVALVAGAILGIGGHLFGRILTIPYRKRRKLEEQQKKQS